MNKFDYVRNNDGLIDVDASVEAFRVQAQTDLEQEQKENVAIDTALDAVFDAKNNARVTIPTLTVLVCEALGDSSPDLAKRVHKFIQTNKNRFAINKGKGIGGVERLRKASV